MNALVNNLFLVYPPFSNQEGEWFYQDPDVRQFVENSKLYMIVHRPELKFKEYTYIAEDFGYFEFKFIMDNIESDLIRISAKEILDALADEEKVDLELGDKLIRTTNTLTKDVLSWYTVDKMLYDIFHDRVKLYKGDKEQLKKFWEFDLLYIGISKKHDSFSRLFKNAHHKRLKILTNESQKTQTSRLTDEVMLLLFDIDIMNVKILNEDNLDDFINNNFVDKVKVFADAEKAFVYFLQAKYNEVQFANYPKGEDGLNSENYNRYTYEINEHLTLCTPNEKFIGRLGLNMKRDAIFVDGEEAIIIKFMNEE